MRVPNARQRVDAHLAEDHLGQVLADAAEGIVARGQHPQDMQHIANASVLATSDAAEGPEGSGPVEIELDGRGRGPLQLDTAPEVD